MDFRLSALISVNRLLWDLVTADLRAVAFRVQGGELNARMVFAEALGEDQQEVVSEVEIYLASDFPPEIKVRVRGVFSPPPAPRELEPGEEWLFLRRET